MRTKTRLSYKKYKQTNTKAKLRLLNKNVVGYFTVKLGNSSWKIQEYGRKGSWGL